jgi:hypothetical protein
VDEESDRVWGVWDRRGYGKIEAGQDREGTDRDEGGEKNRKSGRTRTRRNNREMEMGI